MSNPFEGARPYQVAHIQQLLRALLYCGAALDASDTGTGKTYAALIAYRILGVHPVVFGPRGVKNEWERAAKAVGWECEFINYEKAIRPKYGYGELKPHGSGSYWLWKRQFAGMIFDECHRCSGSVTATGKLLRSAPKASKYVVALSATAAENPLHLKNLGVALGLFQNKDYRNWLLRHGVAPGIFGGFRVKDDEDVNTAAMKKIHDQIFPKRGARMRRALIPGFPQTLIDIRLLESEETEGLQDLITDIEKYGGAPMPEDLEGYHKTRKELDRRLVAPLLDMVKDSVINGCKVVVFPKYIETLDEIVHGLERLGLAVGYVDGRQTGVIGERNRSNYISMFQMNMLDAIVVNQQAGGAGLSLHDPKGQVERDTYIFATDSGRMLKQIFGRVQRDGGAFSRQFLLGFAGTTQEQVLLTSLEKIRNIDTLNDRDLDSLRLI
jgi:hypothetical protein